MATRQGTPCSVEKEIIDYLRHQHVGAKMTRSLLRDWIFEARSVSGTDKEFEEAVRTVEKRYGITFTEGSLAESIRGMSSDGLREQLFFEKQYWPELFSKLDGLELLRGQGRQN